jgi:hypothetical protein
MRGGRQWRVHRRGDCHDPWRRQPIGRIQTTYCRLSPATRSPTVASTSSDADVSRANIRLFVRRGCRAVGMVDPGRTVMDVLSRCLPSCRYSVCRAGPGRGHKITRRIPATHTGVREFRQAAAVSRRRGTRMDGGKWEPSPTADPIMRACRWGRPPRMIDRWPVGDY